MGESVYYIRRALYELRYKESRADGASQVEVLNYCRTRGWPIPVRNFDGALLHLKSLGRATDTGGGDVLTTLYRLTTNGELEDEEQRRPWLRKVGDEMTRPATAAKILIGAAGAIVGIALTLVVQRAF